MVKLLAIAQGTRSGANVNMPTLNAETILNNTTPGTLDFWVPGRYVSCIHPTMEKRTLSEDMQTIEEILEQIEENNAFLRVARTKRRIDDFTRCAVRLEKQLLLAKRRAPVK